MYQYKFTIITVCYNAEKYIKNTIESVLAQSFQDYEYIIKDGRSEDATLSIINSMIEPNGKFRVISDSDCGIYDAMNQAVSLARGEYVLFLNAGDCLIDNFVLEKVNRFVQEQAADIVYGDILQISKERERLRKYRKICSKKLYFLTGDCICHQAIFARTELFGEKQFNTKYLVCADKEWQLYQIEKKRHFVAMSFPVTSVLQEGFSSAHVKDFENETSQCLEIYCKSMIWIYKGIDLIKHNILGKKMLKKAEMMFCVSVKHK